MLRFAHELVFGNGNESSQDDATLSPNQVTQTNVDDDWILIEVACSGEEECEDSGEEAASRSSGWDPAKERPPRQQTVPLTATTQYQYQSAGTDTSPSPTAGQTMDESWFITPPPCFVNHSNQVNIETTPFENLLIEHPSMSVFGPSLPRSASLSSLPSSSSASSSIGSSANSSTSSNPTATANQSTNSQAAARPSRRVNANVNVNNNINNINSRAVALTQWRDAISSMQKAQSNHNQKWLAKNNLDRHNNALLQLKRPPTKKMKMGMRPNGAYSNRKKC